MKEKTTHRTGGKNVFSNGDTRNSSPKQANRACAAQYQKPNNLIEKWTKELSGHLSREGIQVAIKHMQRCSVSLSTREMQIRISMRYHFTPVSMAISKFRQQKMQEGMWREGNLLPWRGVEISVSTPRTAWRAFQTLSNKVPRDPAIPRLGVDPDKTKFSKDAAHQQSWHHWVNHQDTKETKMERDR